MIIGNDIVLNVEDFLGAMINYIAQYGIVILKLYTKKTEKGIFIDYKYNGIKKCYIYTQQF